MSIVKLTKGRSLTLPNKMKFERDVEYTDIHPVLAVKLSERDDFKVTGLTAEDLRIAEEQSSRESKNLRSLIKAINELDVDDANAFDPMGAPNPAALTQILGRRITAEDVTAALSIAGDIDFDDEGDEGEAGSDNPTSDDLIGDEDAKAAASNKGKLHFGGANKKQGELAKLNAGGKKGDKETVIEV